MSTNFKLVETFKIVATYSLIQSFRIQEVNSSLECEFNTCIREKLSITVTAYHGKISLLI